MKFKLICLVSAILVISSLAYSAELNEGFQEIPWGTTVENLSHLSRVRVNGDVSYYVNPSKVFEFNKHIIKDVIYGFYRKQFFAVYIKIDKIELFGEARNYLTTKYGEPSLRASLKSEQTTYQWKYNEIKMKLKVSEKDGKMKLVFYYQPLSVKINEAQQEVFVDRSVEWFPIDKQNPPETLPSIPLLRF